MKNGYLIHTCSSSDARDIAFHVFPDGVGGHFEYWALAELALIFQRGLGAHFPLKCFKLLNPSREKR